MAGQKMCETLGNEALNAIEELGWCRCGDPLLSLLAIEEGLLACESGKYAGDWVAGDKFKMATLLSLNAAGFIAHGTSIDGSWLKPAGKQLLEFFKTVPQDEWVDSIDDAI